MAGIYAPIKSMVSSPMGTSSVQSLPRAGLLFFSRQPNATGADTGRYILPDATGETPDPLAVAIRAATGWVSGVANLFYDAVGASVAVSTSQAEAWSKINKYNVMMSAKGMVIYDPNIDITILLRAYRWMLITYPWSGMYFSNSIMYYTNKPMYFGA